MNGAATLLAAGEQRKLAFDCGEGEARALEFISRRYFRGRYNASDALDLVTHAALANPATMVRLIDSGLRYAAAEDIPVRDHFSSMTNAHKSYRKLPPVLASA